MATPMTAAQTKAALDKWGIKYREIGDWEHHNRAGHGDWGPVHGFVFHHTGDDAPDLQDRAVIVNGRSDLPGPLAQFGLADDGVVELIGCGRCNHAGGGDPKVFQAVVNEAYGDYPPAPHYHEGSPGAVDGNVHFYGCETYYSGSHDPTDATYNTAILLAAAICDFHGWSAKSAIGHKEWSDWKPDPGHVDMKQYRAAVQARLDAGHPSKQGTHPRRDADVALLRATREKADLARTRHGLTELVHFLNDPKPAPK